MKTYASLSGKSLVGKKYHPGRVSDKEENIHPCEDFFWMVEFLSWAHSKYIGYKHMEKVQLSVSGDTIEELGAYLNIFRVEIVDYKTCILSSSCLLHGHVLHVAHGPSQIRVISFVSFIHFN